MKLDFVRVACEGDSLEENGEPIFKIKFSKNLKFAEIFTREKEVYLQWKQLLCPLTIQTNFYEKYNVIKKIGKGSFASVYMVERISDNKRFAVKAFCKSYVNSQDRGRESLVNEINIL